jgi:hypothetical protein
MIKSFFKGNIGEGKPYQDIVRLNACAMAAHSENRRELRIHLTFLGTSVSTFPPRNPSCSSCGCRLSYYGRFRCLFSTRFPQLWPRCSLRHPRIGFRGRGWFRRRGRLPRQFRRRLRLLQKEKAAPPAKQTSVRPNLSTDITGHAYRISAGRFWFDLSGCRGRV